MAERTTDLGAWLARRAAAVRSLPTASAAAAEESRPTLLREGRRHAPRASGALARSLRTSARPIGSDVALALASDSPAARIQEGGGTIKSTRPMTVPIGPERARNRSARDIGGLFAITARDGRRYLATRSGRSLTLHFALRHLVRIKGQGWATKATRATAQRMEPTVRARFLRHLGAQ